MTKLPPQESLLYFWGYILTFPLWLVAAAVLAILLWVYQGIFDKDIYDEII